MRLTYIDVNNAQKLAEVLNFLEDNALSFDSQIEHFAVIYNDTDQVVACGGLSSNIIKCVAISESCRGEGIALQLITELVNLAYSLGRTHLFIYTKPEYQTLFRDCGFYLISAALPNVILLENSSTRLKKYCKKLAEQRVAGEKMGAIVMNANPFTFGHYYLIEQALAQCDHLHLFVVGENRSQFSYQDRFELVKQGIQHLPNITLHAGSDYIISRATFPNYFLKDKRLTDPLYSELDLKLFRQHIAPALGITHRFVGSEPICAVTNEYNREMHRWLQTDTINAPAIQVVEIERKQSGEQPISASRVRQLAAQHNWTALENLVPRTTLAFLQNTSIF